MNICKYFLFYFSCIFLSRESKIKFYLPLILLCTDMPVFNNNFYYVGARSYKVSYILDRGFSRPKKSQMKETRQDRIGRSCLVMPKQPNGPEFIQNLLIYKSRVKHSTDSQYLTIRPFLSLSEQPPLEYVLAAQKQPFYLEVCCQQYTFSLERVSFTG